MSEKEQKKLEEELLREELEVLPSDVLTYLLRYDTDTNTVEMAKTILEERKAAKRYAAKQEALMVGGTSEKSDPTETLPPVETQSDEVGSKKKKIRTEEKISPKDRWGEDASATLTKLSIKCERL